MPASKRNEDEWETVATGTRTRVLFEEVGDQYIGIFQGGESITDKETGEEMRYLNFLTFGAQNGLEDGELVAISRSYSLDAAFDDVEEGKTCRITLKKLVPSKRGNDFKSYQVDVRK